MDELSIAISVKKGNVKTILLEEENSINIPGSIWCVQWLEMHEWKKKASEKETFAVWFRNKMSELIETLEAEPDRSFSGQLENLKKNCIHIIVN